MKPLIPALMFAATLAAQTPTDKTFTIPDFRVTEQSLAKAQHKLPISFLYPPELRNGPNLSKFIQAEPVCLKLRSYRFSKSAAPKLVSETDCTMTTKGSVLRVQR
jgi:hypothetical protein